MSESFFCSLTDDEYKEFLFIYNMEISIVHTLSILKKYNNKKVKFIKRVLFFYQKKVEKLKKNFFLKLTHKYKVHNFIIKDGDIFYEKI